MTTSAWYDGPPFRTVQAPGTPCLAADGRRRALSFGSSPIQARHAPRPFWRVARTASIANPDEPASGCSSGIATCRTQDHPAAAMDQWTASQRKSFAESGLLNDRSTSRLAVGSIHTTRPLLTLTAGPLLAGIAPVTCRSAWGSVERRLPVPRNSYSALDLPFNTSKNRHIKASIDAISTHAVR